MIKIFFDLMQSRSYARIAENISGAASKVSSNSMDAVVSGISYEHSVVSTTNIKLLWFSYGFAAAVALMSLYFLYLIRRNSDTSVKKRYLFTAIGLLILALSVMVVATHYIKQPTFPGNFDMRTT